MVKDNFVRLLVQSEEIFWTIPSSTGLLDWILLIWVGFILKSLLIPLHKLGVIVLPYVKIMIYERYKGAGSKQAISCYWGVNVLVDGMF